MPKYNEQHSALATAQQDGCLSACLHGVSIAKLMLVPTAGRSLGLAKRRLGKETVKQLRRGQHNIVSCARRNCQHDSLFDDVA